MRASQGSFLVALALLLAFLATPATAQNFTLTSNGDTHAASPATSALDAGGQITLRSAMEASTQIAGAHVITIPAGIGVRVHPDTSRRIA